MKKTIVAITFVATGAATPGACYELSTHGALSKRAFDESVFEKDLSLRATLGLPGTSFPSSQGNVRLIGALVELGAELEDAGIRPINHFYDPFYDRALTIPLADASPDWALEDKGPIASGNQEYSYRYAMQYFQLALNASTESTRKQNWGKLFESLGHVIHHIQDMAQPQHLRNDVHFHKDWPIVGDPSLYELCTEKATVSSSDPRGCGSPLSAPTYGKVTFAKARDFWTTRDADAYGRRRGLADFTNRNFVSKDTNFQLKDGHVVVNEDGRYPLPAPITSHTRTLEELLGTSAKFTCDRLKSHPRSQQVTDAKCEIEFFATDVYDAYTAASSTNERASSLSIFDQYLALRPDGNRYATDRLFTLNRFNYAAAHPFLIPRAIGYSAGLIDHFFRGRMKLERATVENGQVRIEIRNASADGNAFGSGTFTLYYDAADGTRKPWTIDQGASLGAAQLASGNVYTLTFAPPDDVDLIAENPFVLVYSGIIGAEDAVSGLVFDVPDVYQGFVFDIAGFEIADRVDGPRLLFRSNGQWKLHPQGNVSAGGEVDWKGWYENGKPTRMLTWAGSRYHESTLGAGIYKGGKLLALAPCPVLGAALQKGPEGEAWVIAVCWRDGADVVLKRPAIRSDSAALYDPVLAPEGWSIIGSFPNPPELSAFPRAWLFNGTGTAAQTMRERKRTDPKVRKPLDRLKIISDGVSAQRYVVGNTPVIWRREYTVNHDCPYEGDSRSATESYVVSIEGESIVAADYIGQQEVLARLKVDSLRIHESAGSYSQQTFGGSGSTTEETLWTLEAGAVSFPILDHVQESLHDYSAQKSEIRSTSTSTRKGESTRLPYFDLRNGLVLRQLSHLESRGLDEQVAGEDWYRGTASTDSRMTSYYEYSIDAGNGTARNYGRADLVDDHVANTRENVNVFEAVADTLGAMCAYMYSVQHTSDASEAEFAATLETVPYLSPRGGFLRSSAATNRDGDVFVSLLIRDSITGEIRSGHFLTGGDPVAVTGATLPSDPLWPLFNDIVPR